MFLLRQTQQRSRRGWRAHSEDGHRIHERIRAMTARCCPRTRVSSHRQPDTARTKQTTPQLPPLPSSKTSETGRQYEGTTSSVIMSATATLPSVHPCRRGAPGARRWRLLRYRRPCQRARLLPHELPRGRRRRRCSADGLDDRSELFTSDLLPVRLRSTKQVTTSAQGRSTNFFNLKPLAGKKRPASGNADPRGAQLIGGRQG